MRRLRKVLLWSGGSLLGLVLVLVLLGYIFEDKLHLMAIRELGKSLHARIEVRETEVSFLRSWPSVRVTLNGLTINPVGKHTARDVIAVESARFKLDFWSVFSDEFKISEVRLDQPKVWMEYDKEGNLNFGDMFQPEDDGQPDDPESKPVSFALRAVRLRDGSFTYHDRRDGQHIRLDSIQLDLDGDFSADQTEITSQFALRLDNWYNGRMSWATDKRISADAVIDARFGEDAVYTLKSGKAQVEAVQLALHGDVRREGEAHRLNIDFGTSQNSFESFLSLLPGGLLDTGREYEYAGDFRAKGHVRGRVGAGETPDVAFDYQVSKGAFQYVGYNSRLSDVNMKGAFNWDHRSPELGGFSVEDFKAQLRGRPISGKFSYTDFSAPLLEFTLKGGIGLQDVQDFYPAFADSTQMRGLVTADLQVEGRLAAFKEKRYKDVQAIGSLAFDSVRIVDKRLQYPIERLSGKVALDNHRLQVSRLSGKVGASDFEVKGTVTEYLSWFFQDTATVRGSVELTSKRLYPDEWMRADAIAGAPEGQQERFEFRLPKGLDFLAHVDIGEFRIANFKATQLRGNCQLKGQQILLESLDMQTLGGSLHVTGKLRAENPQRCLVNIDAKATDIDINTAFQTFDQLAAFALVKDHLYGRYSGDVHIVGALNEFLELDSQSLVSTGNVTMRDAKLVKFEPLEGLAGFVKLDDLRMVEFSDVSTGFKIENEFFYIPKMQVRANRYNLEVSGRHGFDNSLDYKVYVELPRNEARRTRNPKVMEYIETSDPNPVRVVIPVRITGTADHPKYALEGDFIASQAKGAIAKQGNDLEKGLKKEREELFGAKEDTLEVDDLIEVRHSPRDTAKKPGVFDRFKDPLKKLKLPKKMGSK
jgi:hypothetical protein